MSPSLPLIDSSTGLTPVECAAASEDDMKVRCAEQTASDCRYGAIHAPVMP